MVKLLGSLCILAGGGWTWWLQSKERCRRRETLEDLMMALRRMHEEIRIARTPLPLLMEKLAAECGEESARLFHTAAEAARRGEGVEVAWRKGLEQLPLEDRERELLRGLNLGGDEEQICKELSLAAFQLANRAEELERNRLEEEKRATALCFSGAALLVILLI